MTQVSRRFLEKEVQERIFSIFVKTIKRLQREDDINEFIHDLFTPTEKIMLTKRLAVALLLTKGYSYNVISDILKVSRPTIMQAANTLRAERNGYKKAIEQILRDEQKEAFFDSIEEIALKLSSPKQEGSIAHAKKSNRGKQLIHRRRLRRMV